MNQGFSTWAPLQGCFKSITVDGRVYMARAIMKLEKTGRHFGLRHGDGAQVLVWQE